MQVESALEKVTGIIKNDAYKCLIGNKFDKNLYCELMSFVDKIGGPAPVTKDIFFNMGYYGMYSPIFDEITVHVPQQFVDVVSLKFVYLHELSHWTGYKTRLNRSVFKNVPQRGSFTS